MMSPRFIVGNGLSLSEVRELSDDIYTIDLIQNKSILVIADVAFYISNESEIKKWCDLSLTSWSQKGMILGFVNDEERNLFLMRWS
jgi:hypothetical protein